MVLCLQPDHSMNNPKWTDFHCVPDQKIKIDVIVFVYAYGTPFPQRLATAVAQSAHKNGVRRLLGTRTAPAGQALFCQDLLLRRPRPCKTSCGAVFMSRTASVDESSCPENQNCIQNDMTTQSARFLQCIAMIRCSQQLRQPRKTVLQ